MVGVTRLPLLLLVVGGLVWRGWAAEAPVVHVVAPGDTLGAIARQHEVSTRDLQRYNNLNDPNRLAVGQELRIPPGPDVPLRYEVQPGDALSVIARNHGVTTQALLELNELKNPDTLRVGQTLLIPGSARATPRLSPELERQLNRIRLRNGWTHIVIHHSGTAQGSAQGMDRYHREERRMVRGLGYHFVIGNGHGMPDGEIAVGPRWIAQQDGGHLSSAAQNRYAIGICLVGNFDQTHPTLRQMDQLLALVRYLQRRAGIPRGNVTTHTRINVRPTRCPGRHFPTDAFLQRL